MGTERNVVSTVNPGPTPRRYPLASSPRSQISATLPGPPLPITDRQGHDFSCAVRTGSTKALAAEDRLALSPMATMPVVTEVLGTALFSWGLFLVLFLPRQLLNQCVPTVVNAP